jgi:hypothetical protein
VRKTCNALFSFVERFKDYGGRDVHTQADVLVVGWGGGGPPHLVGGIPELGFQRFRRGGAVAFFLWGGIAGSFL